LWSCQFTDAELETRKVRPWPVVPEDIEPVSDTWQAVGAFIFGTALAMIVVFFALMFFTGMWILSLLI
jgi:hypothetical protein